MKSKTAGTFMLALGSLAMAVTGGVARANTCATGFDNAASLKAINHSGTGFVPDSVNPTVYEEPCGTSNRLKIEDTHYGHYHLGVENVCVGANGCRFSTIGDHYEVDFNCLSGKSPPLCVSIDPSQWSRYWSSHLGIPDLRAAMMPSPGTYCITNPSGGTTCGPQTGQFIAPLRVGVRVGSKPARLWGTKFQLIAVGTPSGTKYTFAKVRGLIKDNMQPGTVYNFATVTTKVFDQLEITAVDADEFNGLVLINDISVQY